MTDLPVPAWQTGLRCPHCGGAIELLSTAKVAEQLDIDPSQVRRWAEAGKLAGVKVGRPWVFRAPISAPDRDGRGNPNHCESCGQFIESDMSPIWISPSQSLRLCRRCAEEA